MSKILTIIPTTARRLELINTIITNLINDNLEHTIDIVITKNGTFDNNIYEEFKFNVPVTKEYSYPAANIAAAHNKGLEYLTDHDYVLILEDDFLVKESKWITKLIDILSNKTDIAVLGSRLHGNQKRYHKQPLLEYLSENLFEVYWTDGIVFSPSFIYKDIKYDESFLGATEIPDFCLQVIDKGYKNFYVKLTHEHYSIPESNKYIYSPVPIDFTIPRKLLITKWEKSQNIKIQNYIELDK